MSEHEDAIEQVAQAFENLGSSSRARHNHGQAIGETGEQLSKPKNFLIWWKNLESFYKPYPVVLKGS